MSVALKTPKIREAKPAETAPPEEVLPPQVYRPDCWGLWFWLGCAGVLVLLHVLDWVGALLR
jgi:hypothetical protein